MAHALGEPGCRWLKLAATPRIRALVTWTTTVRGDLQDSFDRKMRLTFILNTVVIWRNAYLLFALSGERQ